MHTLRNNTAFFLSCSKIFICLQKEMSVSTLFPLIHFCSSYSLLLLTCFFFVLFFCYRRFSFRFKDYFNLAQTSSRKRGNGSGQGSNRDHRPTVLSAYHTTRHGRQPICFTLMDTMQEMLLKCIRPC